MTKTRQKRTMTMPKSVRKRTAKDERNDLPAALVDAIGAVGKDARRKDSGVVVASEFKEDSSFLAELRRLSAINPSPDSPSVVSGAESTGCLCGKERIWYADRPDEREGAAAAAVSAFGELLAAGTVQAVADDGTTAQVDVLDTMLGEGLVIRATAEQQMAIRRQYPGMPFVPSVSLYPQMVQVTALNSGATLHVPANVGKPIFVSVTAGGAPISDVSVRGYLSQAQFVEGRTDPNGICELRVPKSHSAKVAVSAIPEHTYWSSLLEIEMAGNAAAVANLELLTLTPTWFTSFARRFGDIDPNTSGTGVRVGVIDTGVSREHTLLQVIDGSSHVHGETNNLDWDDSEGHGTLVAGIIAARGDGVTTPRGLAPACDLRAYRICARGSLRAEEAALATAIRQATADNCDLINISFGGSAQMTAVQKAMRDANAAGAVCIVAAGNGFRRHLSFPACYPQAISVSAMGRLDAYPRNSEFILSETPDVGSDISEYVSSFTNIGDQLLFCAPGVGIVSCWLDNKMAAMRGTSFAAPIVTGLIARILSGPQGGDILQAARNGNRAVGITDLALKSASGYGFQPIHEGYGLPRRQ